MARTKKPHVAKPNLHGRCLLINAAIREGAIVKANVRGEMQEVISIKSDETGVSLLFKDDEGLALMMVKPDAILEFMLLIPRDEVTRL